MKREFRRAKSVFPSISAAIPFLSTAQARSLDAPAELAALPGAEELHEVLL